MLRDAKEAFREGHCANRGAAVLPLRAASTMEGAVDAKGRGADTERGGPSPARTRSSSSTSTSSLSGGGKVGRALGLKEFMHRTRVLDLYRSILKRARAIEDKDVATEARRQFKSSRDETDPLKVQMLVADATNHLEAMQGSTRGAGSTSGSWLDIQDPEDKRGRMGEGFPWQR
ncbi:unnamed protein product [Pylaiella littoralis]